VKTLSERLNEIEADQQKMTWLEACELNERLVKALRHCINEYQFCNPADEEDVLAEIAAILNGEKTNRDLGEKEAK
jgi:hypothetical protein